MMTVQDFAESKNISKAVVDTWIYRHGLPIIKIGRRNYIDENDYIAWQNEHRKIIGKDNPMESSELLLPVNRKKSRIAAKMKRIY